MPLGLRFGSCCLQGRRSDNEDAVGVADYCDLLCFMVADGMGGQQIGALASQRAISTISGELTKPARDRAGCATIDSALRHAIGQAHTEILSLQQPPQRYRCGSTIVLALWLRGTAFLHFAQVGNSGAYRVRDGAIEELTVADFIGETLVANGTITREQLLQLRGGRRSILHAFLGGIPGSHPHLRMVPIQAGDRFLLATDGLTNHTSDEQRLAFLLDKADVQECADGLAQLALEQGSGRDNLSCIVIEVIEDNPAFHRY